MSTSKSIQHRTEEHRSGRTSWLRASVLGANDGLLSTASLVLGVAAGDASLNLRGSIARPRELANGQFDLTLDAPDAAGLRGAAPPDPSGSIQ